MRHHVRSSPVSEDVIRRRTTRVAQITMLAQWQRHLMNELDTARAELREIRAELQAARQLAALYQRAAGIDPADPPPAQLVAAWHGPHPEPCPVTVEIDGIDVTVVVSGAARDPHPGREYRDWQQIQEAHRRGRSHAAGEAP